MKRHPLDALTLVSLAFVAVAGAVWAMWYAGWDPVSIAVAGPLLLVALGVAGLVATIVSARQTSRRTRERALPSDKTPSDPTLTLEDLTGPSDEGEDKR